jgi:hypothetical protein
MIRLLDFALLSFLVWFVWSQLIRGWRSAGAARRRGSGEGGDAGRGPAATTPASAAALTLVRCDGCGVHVPIGRALADGSGAIFCSDTCRARAGVRPRPS